MDTLSKVFVTVLAMSIAVPVCTSAQSADTGYVALSAEEQTDWVSVNLESAGSLGVEVLYKVDKLSDVQNIRISGPLNNADWTTLSNMTSVVNIDLSDASATSLPDRTFYGRSSLKTILLPQGLTSIGKECFKSAGLVEIVIPQTVKTIGQACFYECRSLSTAEVNGVSSLSYQCFSGCDNLTSISLGEGIKSIENQCFENDKNLTEISLPSTLVTIGQYTFQNCLSLTEIVFPESLRSIGYYCFYNNGLKKVILPEMLSTIESSAFAYCNSLTEVVLPAMVFEYSDQFRECRNISKITCRTATPPAIGSNHDPFNQTNKGAITLCVPEFSLVNYKLDTYWLKFGNIESGVTADYWALKSDLSLTNNRRIDGTPSLGILDGGSLTVSGSAPMPVNHLAIRENLYYNGRAFGQLLNSSPAMTANNCTLSFYCDRNRWQFISMPCDVKLSNVSHSAGGSFVFRYYDGESRAANGTGASWKDVPADGVMEAGKAYIYQSDTDGDIVMNLDADGIKGLLAAGHRTVPVSAWASENAANAGWNLVGNPSLTYFDMASTSLTCPITIWDDYNRRYVAYSLIDDDVILYPTQAFFMQQVGENAEITFDAKGRQLTSQVARDARSGATPRAAGNRRLFNITLAYEGEQSYDRTRVVLNDEASLEYESGCDASKFFADGGNEAEIFTIDADGNRLAINERPVSDGKVRLGVYVPVKGQMTLSASRADGDIKLYDSLTGIQTSIGAGSSYTFTSDDCGYIDSRFSLDLSGLTTGIADQAADSDVTVSVNGNVITVTGADGISVTVYAVDGRTVATSSSSASAHSFTLPAGIYIVKAGNSAVKCIVK